MYVHKQDQAHGCSFEATGATQICPDRDSEVCIQQQFSLKSWLTTCNFHRFN